MEHNVETTIIIVGYILGLYRDNGKENGNHHIIPGAERYQAVPSPK